MRLLHWRVVRLRSLPAPLESVARAVLRRPAPPRVPWGRLRRQVPVSRAFGADRGTPVDRYYIEAFLQRHAQDVGGVVLEVKDDSYSRRYGGGRLTRVEVLDVDPANPRATLRGDLNAPGALPPLTFDCVLLTQVLQYVDPGPALRALWDSLLPGGVLLVTVPCGGPTGDVPVGPDLWRATPAGLRRLLTSRLPGASVEVEGGGNALSAVAFLIGAAVEDLTRRELDRLDPSYPVVACARVVKPR